MTKAAWPVLGLALAALLAACVTVQKFRPRPGADPAMLILETTHGI